MFSLIITIVAIALVAALALATLYYGSDAFNDGRAQARAAQLLNEGQQLMGAADLYKSENGVYPTELRQLTEGNYLKSIPVGWAMSPAVAQSASNWVMPAEQTPLFTIAEQDAKVCRSVNKQTYGLDGVLPDYRTYLYGQCFGPMGEFRVAIGKGAGTFDPLDPPIVNFDINPDPMPSAQDTDSWTIPPGSPATAGGGGGGSQPPAQLPEGVLTVTPFYLPDGPNSLYYEENDRAYREGTFFFGYSGGRYVYQSNLNAPDFENKYLRYDLFRVTNNTSAPVLLTFGDAANSIYGALYYGSNSDGLSFCQGDSQQSLQPGESCYVEMERNTYNCGEPNYSEELSDLTLIEFATACKATSTGKLQVQTAAQAAGTVPDDPRPADDGNFDYEFKRVDVGTHLFGSTHQQTLRFTNVGAGPLGIDNIVLYRGGSIASNSCGAVLAEGASCNVTFNINAPTFMGSTYFEVVEVFSDGLNGLFEIAFEGELQTETSVDPNFSRDLPPAYVGTPYSVDLDQYLVTNVPQAAPVTWANYGSLPAGLSFDAATGVISGTPTQVVSNFQLNIYFNSAGADVNGNFVAHVHGNNPLQVMSLADNVNVDDSGACFPTLSGESYCTGFFNVSSPVSQRAFNPADHIREGAAPDPRIKGRHFLRRDGTLAIRNTNVLESEFGYVGTPTFQRVLDFDGEGQVVCAYLDWNFSVIPNLQPKVRCRTPANGDIKVDVIHPFGAGPTIMKTSTLRGCGYAGNTLACWGYIAPYASETVHLGDGNRSIPNSGNISAGNQPVQAVTVTGSYPGVTSMSVSNFDTCIVQNGGVKCWGAGEIALRGVGQSNWVTDSSGRQAVPFPTTVPGLESGVVSVALGSTHACALMQSGQVKCWGDAGSNQLGTGSKLTSSNVYAVDAKPVVNLPTNILSMDAGGDRTCVTTSDNRAYCWGAGPLGGGTYSSSAIPMPVQQ